MRLDADDVAAFADLGVVVEAETGEEAEPDEPADGEVLIMQDNGDVVHLFFDLETQWRVLATPAGLIWLGLDYAAAGAIAGRKRLRRLLEDLRHLEDEAKAILNRDLET